MSARKKVEVASHHSIVTVETHRAVAVKLGLADLIAYLDERHTKIFRLLVDIDAAKVSLAEIVPPHEAARARAELAAMAFNASGEGDSDEAILALRDQVTVAGQRCARLTERRTAAEARLDGLTAKLDSIAFDKSELSSKDQTYGLAAFLERSETSSGQPTWRHRWGASHTAECAVKQAAGASREEKLWWPIHEAAALDEAKDPAHREAVERVFRMRSDAVAARIRAAQAALKAAS